MLLLKQVADLAKNAEAIAEFNELIKDPKNLKRLNQELSSAIAVIDEAEMIKKMKKDSDNLKQENDERAIKLTTDEADYAKRKGKLKDEEKALQDRANLDALTAKETARLNKEAKDKAEETRKVLEAAKETKEELEIALKATNQAKIDHDSTKKIYEGKIKAIADNLEK